MSQIPQAAVTKPQSIPKYLDGRAPNESIRPEFHSRYESQKTAIFLRSIFRGLLERAAILSIGQTLTGCSPLDGDARVKARVSFLWTAAFMGVPAVHDLVPHDSPSRYLASSGQWGGGLARTACCKNSLVLKRLHSDRP